MKKGINSIWQARVAVAAIAIVIMVGGSFTTFGQKSLNAKYPRPDFSEMEEYWDIVDYEYDFTGNGLPAFIVIAKKKVRNVPRKWMVTWYDADGVKMDMGPLLFDNGDRAQAGEALRASAYAPFKRHMPRVKSIKVSEIID